MSKKNDKKSMICLTPKQSPKKFPKELEFLYGLQANVFLEGVVQAQTITPLITLYEAF